MSSVLDIIRGTASVAGQGYAGYAQDEKNTAAQLIAQQKAKLDADNAAVLSRVRLAGIDPKLQGQIAGAKVEGETPGLINRQRLSIPLKVEEQASLLPGEVKKAGDVAAAAAPTQIATHAAERTFDNAHPAPVQPSYSFPVVTDANGKQVVGVGNTKTGEIKPSDTLAKATASAARLTGDQEKSYLFYNLMKNAEPEIAAGLASGKIRPAAISAYLTAGAVGDIPMIGKAAGALVSPLANANLNEDEQKMIRAGKDFTAGVKRKESGQAVSNAEIMETMERYFPGMFGDKPGLTDAKTLARKQYMQTMEQEAGPAIQYYGRQKGSQPTTTPSASGDPEFDALMARYPSKPAKPPV